MIEIRHVDLASAPERLAGAPTDALVVFWSEERPVGQVYLTLPPAGLSTRELADRTVDPTVLNARPPALSPQPARTSVVICTRDRPVLLERCLASLRRQSLPPGEIIVVDNGSAGDECREVARRAGARHLREDRPGLDVARNAGARVATGEVIAYTDDDVQLHPRWLERVIASLADDVDAVTGLVLPAELATPAQLIFEQHWGFGRGFRAVDFGREFFALDRTSGCPVWKIGAGASMAFRRRVFTRIGGFDERLDAGAAGCSGDSEFWYRLLAAGMVVRYAPSAVAFHTHRADLPGLGRQIFAYARGHTAALLIQHEHTGHRANLRRVFVALPLYHARRIGRRLLGDRREADRFLRQELAGWLSGIAFYYRTPRARARVRGRAGDGNPRPAMVGRGEIDRPADATAREITGRP